MVNLFCCLFVFCLSVLFKTANIYFNEHRFSKCFNFSRTSVICMIVAIIKCNFVLSIVGKYVEESGEGLDNFLNNAIFRKIE
jgi:hypothetical protein